MKIFDQIDGTHNVPNNLSVKCIFELQEMPSKPGMIEYFDDGLFLISSPNITQFLRITNGQKLKTMV